MKLDKDETISFLREWWGIVMMIATALFIAGYLMANYKTSDPEKEKAEAHIKQLKLQAEEKAKEEEKRKELLVNRQVICVSAIDNSTIKSSTARTWISYTHIFAYWGKTVEGYEVLFQPRVGDNCMIYLVK